MAQPQQNIHIAAPGFAGLNTQDSPVGLPIEFAAQADNCVIDRHGRVASREGFKAYTENHSDITLPVEVVQEFIQENGTEWLLACTDGKIWTQEIGGNKELTALTGHAGTATDNNWQLVPFNDQCICVQSGEIPKVFDPATSTSVLQTFTAVPSGALYPNCATAAFGHMWLADFDDDKSILFWSVLMDGDDFTGSGTGSIDLKEHWPSGYDRVVAIAAHNNFMVVFGSRSILLFEVPETGPVNMVLVDAIEGIGCIARDSVQHIGTDIYFLDITGVRTLNRTIQEKSIPVGDISRNVRTDIREHLASVSDHSTIKSAYQGDRSFYTLFIPSRSIVYVFDTRGLLENGAARTTVWPTSTVQCASKSISGAHYYAGSGGVYEYFDGDDEIIEVVDAVDVRVTYPIAMKYYTHPQVFDSPANLKFPKQVDITTFGSTTFTLNLRWAYDYSTDFDNLILVDVSGDDQIFEYNADLASPTYAEFTGSVGGGVDAEYTGSEVALSSHRLNIWGSGTNVTFGFEANVYGTQFSIQEINIQALVGRLL